MKEDRQEKLKLSNELLDAMLVGVKTQEDLWGKDGIITQINNALLERNGYSKKTLKSKFGSMELSTPRDRHSTFEPKVIPKCSTKSAMLEEAILALYAKGMSTTKQYTWLWLSTWMNTRSYLGYG